MAQVKRALDQLETDLAARKNVVGLGTVPANENSPSSSEMAVAVYVKKKLPKSKLTAKDVVPKSVKIRGRRGEIEVPVRVIEQGEVKLEGLGKE